MHGPLPEPHRKPDKVWSRGNLTFHLWSPGLYHEDLLQSLEHTVRIFEDGIAVMRVSGPREFCRTIVRQHMAKSESQEKESNQ